MHSPEPPPPIAVLEQRELLAGLAELRLDGLIEGVFVTEVFIPTHDAAEAGERGDGLDAGRTHAHHREPHVRADALAAQVLDVVGEGGLTPRAHPGLDGPPAQVAGQEHPSQAGVGPAVDVDELLVAPGRVVPRAHAGTDVPQVMVERAHLHHRGSGEPLADLEDELRAVMPAVRPAAERVLAVERVHVDHVEAARVERLGRLGRHLGQERRVAVGQEQAEALLEMVHLRAGLMGGRLRAERAARALRERIRRGLGDVRVGDQLVVDPERHAVADEEPGRGGHLLGRFGDGHGLGVGRQGAG